MIVHYYEASALANPGSAPGQLTTLDNRHKAAWRLFSGGEDIPGNERPFLFRAESLAPSHELFMLRSSYSFQGATPHQLDLSAGTTLDIEWVTTPSISVAQQGKRGRRRQAFPEEWRDVGLRLLTQAGFSPDDPAAISCQLHERRPHFSPDKPPVRLVRYRAQVAVTDPQQAAQAWLAGIGRQRAYGMGMLCLTQTTSTNHEATAQ